MSVSSAFCESLNRKNSLKCTAVGKVYLQKRLGRRGNHFWQSHAVSEEAAQSTTGAAEQVGEENEVENEEVEEEEATSSPSFFGAKELMERYKEAILKDDETAIAEAQAQLEALENDRSYLSQQVASLTEEVSLGKDRFLRLNADFDNFRKRAENEKKAMATTVKAEVVGGLLPMIDNFERAKGAIKAETEGEQKIDNSYQGIYKQFVEAMKSMGVTAIETVGKEFDPNLHEAIMREDSTAVFEGFVLQEFRKGFTIGEKLLRPAMVKVSAGPGPSSGPDSDASAQEAAAEETEAADSV